jgi:hypothetical protein
MGWTSPGARVEPRLSFTVPEIIRQLYPRIARYCSQILRLGPKQGALRVQDIQECELTQAIASIHGLERALGAGGGLLVVTS